MVRSPGSEENDPEHQQHSGNHRRAIHLGDHELDGFVQRRDLSTGADGSSISPQGDLMSKLQQLEQTDPAEFKAVTQQISAQLKTEAGNATRPQADFLNKMSANFAAASSSASSAIQNALDLVNQALGVSSSSWTTLSTT